MAALRSRCCIIFLSCFFFLVLSSPNLSGRRLHVYHTPARGVAFVRIENAGLNVLRAVRWKYRTQKWRKNCYPHHGTNLSGYIFATKACIDNRRSEKNLLNINISWTCPCNMANFGLLTAEIFLPVWAPHQISNGFASWLRYCSDVAHRSPTELFVWPSPGLVHYT